jgi:alkylhydroperoxidase family enzyme
MQFAAKVARDASSITASDVETLRRRGLSDAEIFDVVSAAAVRCFFSKTLDALGVQPDTTYNDIEPRLRARLAIGRSIEGQ